MPDNSTMTETTDMAIEIERKFLVSQQNLGVAKSRATSFRTIRQGYLLTKVNKSVRVRLSETGSAKTAHLSIKGPKIGSMSVEFEYEIPHNDGLHLLTMCEHVLDKVRYNVIDQHGQFWEVDVFDGLNKGLVVAEIEMVDTNQKITIPDWVGREVTTDPAYTNAVLVKQKAPVE